MAMKEMMCPSCGYRQKVKEDVKLVTHGCHISGKYEFVMIQVETKNK
jgi:hypothetical protein